MKRAFRKSLKRQSSLGGYFKGATSSANHETSLESPILWQALAKKYQYNFPRDWHRIEAHWIDQIESFQEQPIDCPGRDGQMNTAITRISQCNESYQLCNSLPRSFIVPKDLKDVILIDTLSTIIKNHRVPVITYCCPIEYKRNFIIRCASASSEQHQGRIVEIVSRAVKPLEVLELDKLGPSLEKIEKAHKRLLNACKRSDDDNDNHSNSNTNFISKSGKWLKRVSQALKLANKTAQTLLTQASVILMENEDRGWNCVISSLVQLMLEPHRRTIDGFESLLSKEWIYLTGHHLIVEPINQKAQKYRMQPNILFDLFLDCTYQIYLQNPLEFEFTARYLSYLMNSQHDPSTGSSYQMNGELDLNNRVNKTDCESMKKNNSSRFSYKPANRLNKETYSLDALRSFDDGKIAMLNLVYRPNKDKQILVVYDHVVNMKLWSSQYICKPLDFDPVKINDYDNNCNDKCDGDQIISENNNDT